MTDWQPQPQELGLQARLVLLGLILLAAAGVIWYGVTLSTIQRLWRQLIERPDGPMAFRFILQPLMGAIVAFLHGRKDARRGRTPYFGRW
jgi:TRAP-type C4-dicarboxylate transport system permease small subunit